MLNKNVRNVPGMGTLEISEIVANTTNNGAPGEIRTPDPLVRSQVLYPAELRARYFEAGNYA